MKTLEELKHFYKTELMEALRGLEQNRVQTARKVGICFSVVGVIAVVGVLLFLAGGFGGFHPAAVMIPLVLCVIIGGGLYKVFTRGYVAEFKSVVIRSIVKFIDENLSYNPRGFIARSVFMESKIFTTKPNRYKGDDLVEGRVGATAIKFSELNAVYESGSGKNKHRYTVFKGLFFLGDFNKHFRGQTLVLPDTAEKLFGRLGKKLQSMNVFRGKLIKLEDPEFEKYFVVYGGDQIEARYILSPSLMERIVGFKKKTGKQIYLSFVGSIVFVAVPYTKNLFEPKLFSTLLDFGPIREYFEDLQLAVGIVDELNLNTRIWSKE